MHFVPNWGTRAYKSKFVFLPQAFNRSCGCLNLHNESNCPAGPLARQANNGQTKCKSAQYRLGIGLTRLSRSLRDGLVILKVGRRDVFNYKPEAFVLRQVLQNPGHIMKLGETTRTECVIKNKMTGQKQHQQKKKQ